MRRKGRGRKMSELFDEEFQQDAMGVAALLVVGAVAVASIVIIAISVYNWNDFFWGVI